MSQKRQQYLWNAAGLFFVPQAQVTWTHDSPQCYSLISSGSANSALCWPPFLLPVSNFSCLSSFAKKVLKFSPTKKNRMGSRQLWATHEQSVTTAALRTSQMESQELLCLPLLTSNSVYKNTVRMTWYGKKQMMKELRLMITKAKAFFLEMVTMRWAGPGLHNL